MQTPSLRKLRCLPGHSGDPRTKPGGRSSGWLIDSIVCCRKRKAALDGQSSVTSVSGSDSSNNTVNAQCASAEYRRLLENLHYNGTVHLWIRMVFLTSSTLQREVFHQQQMSLPVSMCFGWNGIYLVQIALRFCAPKSFWGQVLGARTASSPASLVIRDPDELHLLLPALSSAPMGPALTGLYLNQDIRKMSICQVSHRQEEWEGQNQGEHSLSFQTNL